MNFILPADKKLQFMPVRADKRPIHTEWQMARRDYDFSKAEAVGLVCGEISGNVEAIDFDLKYDLTGKLFQQFKNAVHEIDPTILPLMVVQKTVSNGFHFIYRCETIDGNLKLANRYATDQEKAKGDKVKVLIETRGEKGYIACDPTPGYKLIYGSFENIQTITPEQRQTLFSVAYSFNEVLQEYKHPKVERKQIKGLTPIDDYNDRADVVALLEKHGWTATGRRGSKTLMLRPGDTKAKQSGNYDHDKKWFSVFSTSTEFESQKPYQPYAVYTVLECNKDFKAVPRKLYEEGYGDREDTIQENRIEVPSIVSTSDDDYSFLATPDDYEEYLNRWRTGTFEMGKTTGIDALDKHYLFKEGDLVIVNGIDNVGKSTVIWYLSVLSNIHHNWKWLIFSSENKLGSIVRKLIEFYWSEPIHSMTDEQYEEGRKYVANNFDIIKCSDKLYNYQDILNMVTKASKRKKYHALMIDPYNSLKVDIPAKSKQQTYDYHYEAASVMQLYGKQNNISIYLNCHVGTVGARNKDNSGFTKAPQKEDTEMGVMFANKADQFITVHRITQHPTDWKYTEIHVRKVKETETGGRVTPYAMPVSLRMVVGACGFEWVPTRVDGTPGYNPVKQFHESRKPKDVNKFIEPIKQEYVSALQPSQTFDITTEAEEPPF